MTMLAESRLDDTDKRLLSLLRDDARQTIAQLAKELGISRGQIYTRLARLEEEQVVAGYTVRLGHAFTASRMRAHVMIKTLPRFHREVELALARLPQVQSIHAISGEYDVIAMLETDGSNSLNELIDDIGLLEGVERTTTSVILATKLER
ncbi:Lrp/AsnC family transcriptional regulator [Sphingorhabdus sp.]|jgi:DNA-binding Lrp family transcriptional regulator|uniref:Lrp/AsnC family transcriptional regulator n=1 Tax=Sphingorhabdus sp. TaxID=1902408 RepID=UPI0035B34CD8